jgi:methyl-accepting chemotaxis protein
VRTLAQRSASAAKEIKTLIADSTSKVTNGSKLVGEAGTTMDEIVTSVTRVTEIMSSISATSRDQTQRIDQVNDAVRGMDEITQQNAALVEQAAAAADSMQEQARQLHAEIAVFDLGARTESDIEVAALESRQSPQQERSSVIVRSLKLFRRASRNQDPSEASNAGTVSEPRAANNSEEIVSRVRVANY